MEFEKFGNENQEMLLQYKFKFANCRKLKSGVGIEDCIEFVKEHHPNFFPISILVQALYLFAHLKSQVIHFMQ